MNSLLLALISPVLFTLNICEKGTNCQTCVETIQLTYAADAARQEVRITKRSDKVVDVEQTLKQCEVRDDRNWACRDVVTRVEAKDGRVKMTRPPEHGGRYDLCTA